MVEVGRGRKRDSERQSKDSIETRCLKDVRAKGGKKGKSDTGYAARNLRVGGKRIAAKIRISSKSREEFEGGGARENPKKLLGLVPDMATCRCTDERKS